MSKYLMVDFGSTFTKLTLVDSTTDEIVTEVSPTTVQTDITIGYQNGLNKLYLKTGMIKFDKIIASSSAAGGLKMCAIGLIKELTVEAARRACLGAGARVDVCLSSYINDQEIEDIKTKAIDIILLAGGTDGGNSDCVIHNAIKLGEAKIKIPIIYAGNKSAQDEVLKIFKKYKLNYSLAANIMPNINKLNIDEAKELIRNLFLSNIIKAKGIKKIENLIDEVILPTPLAVLNACNLLSKGYLKTEGLNELIALDIGGATTDFYSISSPSAKRSDVVLKGLEELHSKRTVEGDLGMRYSSLGVYNTLSEEEKKLIELETGFDLKKEIDIRLKDVSLISSESKDLEIDNLLASICIDKATSRHAGKLEEFYTPMGVCYNQIGKDLSGIQTVIGTGGILINSNDPKKILKEVAYKKTKPLELRPVSPNYYLDKDYILPAMGLLSTIDPFLALKIMLKRIQKI